MSLRIAGYRAACGDVRKANMVRNMNSVRIAADVAKILEIETHDIILFQVY